MSIIATKPENGNFIQVEPGVYLARCYSMIEIGTIETEYLGKKKKQKKVSISWELPTEQAVFHEDIGPQPFVVSKRYTLSMFKDANLRKDLESWRGKAYTDEEAEKVDITKLIGQPCLLSVIHAPRPDDPTKSYTQITSVTKMMKGQECPAQINPTAVLSYDKFDWELFDGLPDFLKDMIKKSDEFRYMQTPADQSRPDDMHESLPTTEDDLPF